MRELVIDRKTWYRGKGSELSRLLRIDDETMCCLGFYSRECGLTADQIYDVGFPSMLVDPYDGSDPIELPVTMEWLLDMDIARRDAVELVIGTINDDPAISDELREEKLTAIFAEHGVNVTFIN